MDIKQIYKTTIVGLLFLCVGTSCHKDIFVANSCTDGSCCFSDYKNLKLITELKGVEAFFVGNPEVGGFSNGFTIKDTLRKPNYYNLTTNSLLICPKADLKTYPLTAFSWQIGQIPFPSWKYKLWGRVWDNQDIIGITSYPIYWIEITRVDKL